MEAVRLPGRSFRMEKRSMKAKGILFVLAMGAACLAAWTGRMVMGQQVTQPGMQAAPDAPGVLPDMVPAEPGAIPPGAVPAPKPVGGKKSRLAAAPAGKVSAPPAVSPPVVGGPTPPPVMDGGPVTVSPVIEGAPAVNEPVVDAVPTATNDNPTGRQEPAVSIEWIGPPTAKLGQPVTYQIIVKNISSSAVNQVVVRNRLPAGVTVSATEPKAVTDGNMLIWDLGTLQPRQEKRLDLKMLPEAKGDLACQAMVTLTGSSTARLRVREPKLQLKASAPDKVVLGDMATVTLTVTNPGDGTADRVKIKATLSDGLENARGKTIDFDVGDLAPKETRSVQLVCSTKAGGEQKCEAVAVSDGNLTSQDAAAIDVVLPQVDLAVTGPRLRYLDRHATYVFKITNPGSASANNVTISDQIPQGFKFVTASDGGRHDFTTRTVSWFLGDLPPGQSREVTLEVVAVNTGEHKHKITVTAARGLKTEAEALTRVEGLSALLMELIDLDDPVEVGADTSYEIHVTNTGSKTETNLQLICTIPDKMEFRGAKCPANCRFHLEGKDVVFEALPKLAPRADAFYRVNVRGTAAGDLRFRARIKADGLTEPVLKEESTKVYGDDVLPK